MAFLLVPLTDIYGIRVQVQRLPELGFLDEADDTHVRHGGRESSPHSSRGPGGLSSRRLGLIEGFRWGHPLATTILFVDDDDFIRGAYGDLLRDEGYSVVEAADGCQALEAAEAIPGEMLLVLDELMPCMRGSEVLERLDRRTDASRFRVVIISGSGNPEVYALPRRGIRIHAVVEKPFTADELLGVLHKLAA